MSLAGPPAAAGALRRLIGPSVGRSPGRWLRAAGARLGDSGSHTVQGFSDHGMAGHPTGDPGSIESPRNSLKLTVSTV
eukprot:746987-Hanusia_phi.AAC.2